jgi:hypothetical protein
MSRWVVDQGFKRSDAEIRLKGRRFNNHFELENLDIVKSVYRCAEKSDQPSVPRGTGLREGVELAEK